MHAEKPTASPSRASRAPIPTPPAATSIPPMEPLPCPTFEDAFNAVETGKADLAMIPIENTIAGRVADIHHLLPESQAAHRRRIFPADPFPADGAARASSARKSRPFTATSMRSASAARYIRKNGWKPVVAGDTAGAAQADRRGQGPHAWPRWRRAGRELYGLDIIDGECRGHRQQHHPLRRSVEEQAMGRARRRRQPR